MRRMKWIAPRAVVRRSAMGIAMVLALAVPAGQVGAKDVGPTSAPCDAHAKGGAAWTSCVASRSAGDDELFYAGYWLAKSGRYAEALVYLERVVDKGPRVLTYIGFAERKLGALDAALASYGRALAADPNFTVARAYLGEAHLTLGAPERAEAELAEIARRCGTSCAEYADLAGHIAAYRSGSVSPRG